LVKNETSDGTRRPQPETVIEPDEPDFELLRTRFESQQHYHSLFIAHQLFGKTEQTILHIMKEMRAMAATSDNRKVSSEVCAVCVSSRDICGSQNTTLLHDDTHTHIQQSLAAPNNLYSGTTRMDRMSQESLDRMQDPRCLDTATLRRKLCLYLEALYYAREVGVVI